MPSRGVLAGLGLVALLLAPGCSSQEPAVPEFTQAPSDAAPDPGGSATSSAGTEGTAGSEGDAPVAVVPAGELPTDPADAAVYQAYIDFWTADAAALADPGLPLDSLSALLLEPQRTRTTGFIQEQRADGQRSVGVIRLDPVVVLRDATRAVLDDCLDDSGLSAVDSSGAPVPDSQGTGQAVRVTLTSVEGRWLVDDVQGREGASCP